MMLLFLVVLTVFVLLMVAGIAFNLYLYRRGAFEAQQVDYAILMPPVPAVAEVNNEQRSISLRAPEGSIGGAVLRGLLMLLGLLLIAGLLLVQMISLLHW